MLSGDTGFDHLVYSSPYCEVWLCNLVRAPSTDEIATLSREEAARADRFLDITHKARYRAAHVALRRLISHRTGLPAKQLDFLNQKFGKPCLAGPAGCFFNLSHSGDLALVAISSQYEVGVDIELFRELDEVHDLAEQHLTPTELKNWSELPSAEQVSAFYQIWVRKEACVKSIGLGLRTPLTAVEVGMEPFEKLVRIAPLDANSSALTEVKVQSITTRAGSFAAVAWMS